VYCCKSKTQNYYLWDETVAERGSDEIGSVLYKWVMDNHKGNFDRLQVIMDNCAGKNNIIMFDK